MIEQEADMLFEAGSKPPSALPLFLALLLPYLRVFMNSAIDLASASLTPAMPFL
jgi:hypothetical protein